jgi:hypothetical protein
MHRFTNFTAWNSHGRYFWADLDAGPRHGPFALFQEAQEDASRESGKPDLLLYGSCPDRFSVPDTVQCAGFTQHMAETYGDNRE